MIRAGSSLLVALAVLWLGGTADAQAQQSEMTFFITSAGSGKGGDLGGLSGADARCQLLGAAAGAGTKTWRAYLSTLGAGAVNARDRIGPGPWQNAKGIVVAKDLAELHGDDRTCSNWTKSGEGAAMAGHHDRLGLRDDDASKSQNDLRGTGGSGLFYCFATR
jgi:hypothetical protein